MRRTYEGSVETAAELDEEAERLGWLVVDWEEEEVPIVVTPAASTTHMQDTLLVSAEDGV